jgi:hypothetical protein
MALIENLTLTAGDGQVVSFNVRGAAIEQIERLWALTRAEMGTEASALRLCLGVLRAAKQQDGTDALQAALLAGLSANFGLSEPLEGKPARLCSLCMSVLCSY